MKRFFLLAAAMLAGLSLSAQNELRMLVGTYTENTSAEGVYLYKFNQETAEFVLLDTARCDNPSFIVPSDDRRFAYAVCEFKDGREGAYSFRLTDNSVDLLNWQPTGGAYSGADPCNVLLLDGHMITSNYTGGSVTSFPIAADGLLGPQDWQFAPSWPDHISPHIHQALLSPDGKYVFVNDLGSDAVYRFERNGSGKLGDDELAFKFRGINITGPRHSTFSPDGRFMYMLSELGDQLNVFRYEDGKLTSVHNLKAYSGNGKGSADIHYSPDGRFLYTSHRLKNDGISVFSVNPQTGRVKRTAFQKTGIHPRNFAITPNGKYLLCACRDSNAIEIYVIDQTDGKLADTGKRIELGAPVCIQLY
ncbi:MAG: lactonase family protein [Bacteroidales bacterium]|nr:lactonase family protein [Bacteroidales bacterium]